MRSAIIHLLIVLMVLASSQVQAQRVDRAKRGLILARQICSQCHAVEKGARSPTVSAPPFEVIANTPGMTATAISAALQTSHRTMPNVMLDSDQLSKIVAYLLSLKQTDR